MTFKGAVIKEQGVTFGIIYVKPYVLNNSADSEQIRQFGIRMFGIIPIVLMAQDSRGVPTYLGRPDIVRFLRNISPYRLPWKQYTVV